MIVQVIHRAHGHSRGERIIAIGVSPKPPLVRWEGLLSSALLSEETCVEIDSCLQ